jgi:adenylyltransferase/sulfurtransferase
MEATMQAILDPETRQRYARQILVSHIGEAGQQKLREAAVVLVGCGALGSVLAELMVRAGIGRLRIIDRDFVELSNLPRQLLFDENDAHQLLPKAAAAARKLQAANRDVHIEAEVADLRPDNALNLLTGFALILDGTDNFETRFLINDVAVRLGVPWIYSGVLAATGVVLPVLPGHTACLACLLAAGADPGPTCDTAGVLNAAATATAALAAAQALRLLIEGQTDGCLLSCEVWTGRLQRLAVARDPACPVCVQHQFRFLEGKAQAHVTLCGRDSVQIHERRRRLDLPALAARLAATGAEVRGNDYLLRVQVGELSLTVFADGRAVIGGTRDPAVARTLYARYVGA